MTGEVIALSTPQRSSGVILRQTADSLECSLFLPRTRQCVFNAWTIPEYIELWSNTEQGYEVRAEVDWDAGIMVLSAQRDAQMAYLIQGTCVAFDRPSRLALAWRFRSPGWDWDSVIQIDLDEMHCGTMLRFVQSGMNRADQREHQEHWWQRRLERLVTLLS